MIGVFDSGVGGLSILREIRARLPGESLTYVADTAHLPYGDKTPAYIEARALALTEWLVAEGARAIVVACNTATAATVNTLRHRYAIPIVGVEPAVKPAAAQTRSGVIGVLATPGTLGSERFDRLVESHGRTVRVLRQPCRGWVEQVERGEFDTPATRALVRKTVEPLIQAGADTLVLGCTHYPFLRPVLEEIAGEAVAILDTGAPVAGELQRRLQATGLDRKPARPQLRLFSTGDCTALAAVSMKLWSSDAVQLASEPLLT